jgi:hypothetical protein
MNLSDAQGRLARWRLRLSEFTFKVEYHPGAAHHAADALSRLPHQAIPPDPIEEEIPVCSVSAQANRTSVTRDNPCAFEESSPSPIEEEPVIPMSEVFDHQCLDPTARRLQEQTVCDPSWYFDQNGLLVQYLPTDEVSLHVPMSLPKPCTIIQPCQESSSTSPPHVKAQIPVAVDGSVLRRGDGRNEIPGTPVAKTLTPPAKTVIRILTRSPGSCQRTTDVGLALATVPDGISAIPTGLDAGAADITFDELRERQAADPDCQLFLSLTALSDLFDLNDDGVLIRISPSDGSRQVVVHKVLVPRVLSLEH